MAYFIISRKTTYCCGNTGNHKSSSSSFYVRLFRKQQGNLIDQSLAQGHHQTSQERVPHPMPNQALRSHVPGGLRTYSRDSIESKETMLNAIWNKKPDLKGTEKIPVTSGQNTGLCSSRVTAPWSLCTSFLSPHSPFAILCSFPVSSL